MDQDLKMLGVITAGVITILMVSNSSFSAASQFSNFQFILHVLPNIN